MIFALIIATALLVAIPGPNVALIVANTLRRGFQIGILTVLGTTLGVGLQLVFVVLGLTTVLHYAANLMVWIKWIGVAYLIYLEVKAWRENAEGLSFNGSTSLSPANLFWQGFGLAVINPKTLLFNAAFLPLFAGDNADAGRWVVLSGTYLAVLFAGDVAWAAFANSARPLIDRIGSLRNRLTGGLLLTSGVGLAAARVHE